MGQLSEECAAILTNTNTNTNTNPADVVTLQSKLEDVVMDLTDQ